MNILGIETSCDETAAAVVEDGRRILASIVASQVDLHARYGGIVPEVASRKHLENIIPVVEAALDASHCTLSDLGALAVTYGPGLAGSLLVGLNVAKALAMVRSLPLVGVNHLEGHIYANWLVEGDEPSLPALCLVVSGGHTDLVIMEGHGRYRRLGHTLDDAAGEAFDKVARLLGLGFPGGPAIERVARAAPALRLPRARVAGPYDFSFSGLKTAVLRLVQGEGDAPPVAETAAAFQEAVVDALVTKTVRAAQENQAAEILLAGGVAANSRLRQSLAQRLPAGRQGSPLPLRVPPLSLCTDNAAMIAACAYYRLRAGHQDGLDLDVQPGLRIG
ncbi:MAG: tRNA (adenosine(37)-N6)-threonylcarbamoyltransferase complex transferase subunit TsaD [Chloroflexota bacterium]|nr:tRNA (adenosine(37)-N6)-threonylcarbamoyltransferase complex transferase subunit TsaD [Chloroflexota bacterium]